ncbi:MAG: cytochrome c3 family protein [Deltaproteobacteria bacterium]|nr:cytochrome c3 family protein [Deltaproteobacteria bacterium]
MIPIIVINTAMFLSVFLWAADNGVNQEASSECLACHGEKDVGALRFYDGKKKSVFIDSKVWNSSVHTGRLSCVDCHREISGYPHPSVKYKDGEEYTAVKTETCKRCHYTHYTRLLDSIHYEVLKNGGSGAPGCVECHGSHGIQKAATPRISINEKCGQCHGDVDSEYRNSVHGKALVDENNQDVPVCSDCHSAHDIRNPTDIEYKVNSYKLCGKCHGDAERMKKYNLNPDVLTTYLEDFHGASNQLYSTGAEVPGKLVAVCTDCHGYHSIESVHLPGQAEKVRENVLKTCQKCHQGAMPAFGDAWLSHYKPTLATAPLVWGVKWFYNIVIPFIVLGLVLHILLDLWRYGVRRRKG